MFSSFLPVPLSCVLICITAPSPKSTFTFSPPRLTGGDAEDLVVLSNGDPVTFARIESKEEADNLAAWINHILGVQVEKEEEVQKVKVKEIVDDILNESFDLLEEAEEEEEKDEVNDSGLLEELCPEEEEEEEDLVLAEVE